MTSVLWLIMCLTDVAAAQANNKVDLVQRLSELHRLNWAQLDVQSTEKRLGVQLAVVDAEIPSDSAFAEGGCEGSIYGTTTSRDGSIRLEFRKLARSDGKCGVALYSARLDLTVPPSDGEKTRSAIIAALQAAGKTCDAEVPEYRWRSDDSLTLFSLSMNAEPEVRGRVALLSVWLRHIPVTPHMVDDLPFHKGFVSPLGAGASEKTP